jgi:acyl dehydratase
MGLPTKHIRHQLPVIASLGGTALAALRQSVLKPAPKGAPATPSPELKKTIPPRAPELVADYVRWCGGDPGGYRGVLPPHLFPQWGFPLAARTLEGLPYPMARVLNGGCRLEILRPLPANEPLVVSARLEDIDDNGRRAVLHQKVVTGTASVPEAIVGHLYAIVPLGGAKGAKGDRPPANGAPKADKKDVARVPDGARELGYWRIPADAGLAFAMLTGDFNPVHWIPGYARAFGFKSTILHGFATMARAIEGLNRGLFAGDTRRLRTFDCKFVKPLLLPAEVGLYVDGAQVYVGDAPGGPAYLVGTFTTQE